MVVHGMFPFPMLNAPQGSVRILWLYWPPRTGFKTWLSSRNTNICGKRFGFNPTIFSRKRYAVIVTCVLRLHG